MAVVVDACKHCGREISSRNGLPDTWLHTDTRQCTRTCVLEPLGYDAAPASQPCNPICRGRADDEIITPADQTVWSVIRPRIGLVDVYATEAAARDTWVRGDTIWEVQMTGWQEVT